MKEAKVVVMHRGGLAFYFVSEKEAGMFHAHLSRYDGRTKDAPPPDVLLFQKGDTWLAQGENHTLVSELGKLIEQKLLKSAAP